MSWRKAYLDFLKQHPHFVGAEVGVYEGENATSLLRGLKELKILYCVDSWSAYEGYTIENTPAKDDQSKTFENVFSTFTVGTAPFADRVKVIVGDSVSAVKEIEDSVLDFVFIDGNHEYKYVKKDIIAWTPKVKKGGIISGHDYTNNPKAIRYGVKLAVDELFPNKKLIGNIWWVEKE